jgi:hypothetical protein
MRCDLCLGMAEWGFTTLEYCNKMPCGGEEMS